jgi:protein-tyrosine-phosphatase
MPALPAEEREDWGLPDPKKMPPEAFNKVRDEIERRVQALIASIQS